MQGQGYTGVRLRNASGEQRLGKVEAGELGRAGSTPGFPAELYRLSLGGLHTAQSPSTKKRWPTGWQSHCMAMGTEPLCARQAWRALFRKKCCGEGGGLSLCLRQWLWASSCGAPSTHCAQLPAPPHRHSLSESARPEGGGS